jgi:hypothetical protein
MKYLLNVGITICLLSIACNNQSTQKDKVEAAQTDDMTIKSTNNFYKKFHGNIGNDIKLTMDLTLSDSTFSGSYYVENDAAFYLITGQLLASNEITLKAQNEKYKEVAVFHGKLMSPQIFEGTWISGKTKFPFTLTEVQNNDMQIIFQELRSQNCDAKKKDTSKRCSYIDINMIRLALPNNSASEKINTAITKLIIGNQYQSINQYLKSVNDNQEFFSEVNIDFTVESNEEELICIGYLSYQYDDGAAHPLFSVTFKNYDLKTGEEITLDMLFKREFEGKLNQLAEKIFVDMNGKEGWDFEPGKFKINNNFIIQKRGLLFQYNDYEIGTYLSRPSVFIPYAQIKDLIKEDGILGKIMKL